MRLRREAGFARPPPLLVLTDPERTPDPVALARRLPPGAGLVLRHFGRPGAATIARALAEVAKTQGLTLLIADDPRLAAAVGAAGVHLPERSLAQARGLRAQRPRWIVTAAAHSARALARAAEVGAHAALLSTVFASPSSSAGPAMGPARFAALVGEAKLPVYALGGVTGATAPRLIATGASGVACIGAFAQ